LLIRSDSRSCFLSTRRWCFRFGLIRLIMQSAPMVVGDQFLDHPTVPTYLSAINATSMTIVAARSDHTIRFLYRSRSSLMRHSVCWQDLRSSKLWSTRSSRWNLNDIVHVQFKLNIECFNFVRAPSYCLIFFSELTSSLVQHKKLIPA
jgi:hypothetical protein